MPRWKVRLCWTLFLSSLVLGAMTLLDRHGPRSSFAGHEADLSDRERRELLRFSLYRVLFDYGIRVEWISGDRYYKTVRIPRDLAMVEPYASLVARFRKLGGTLLKAESNPSGSKRVIEVGFHNEPLLQVKLVQDDRISRVKGQIAIVIDDFGNSYKSHIRDFLHLEQRITVGVLPGLKYSGEIATAAKGNGLEVMIHMPMEPQNGQFKSDDYILLTNMSEKEIRRRMNKALEAVPHASGLNNHMGSRATTDERLLAALVSELERHRLFFLDSKTSPESRACAVARRLDVSCGTNDAFLDAIKEEPFIRQQVLSLAELASRKGQAIGIAHPERMTLKVLQQELPKLEKRGFQFVSVSEFVK